MTMPVVDVHGDDRIGTWLHADELAQFVDYADSLGVEAPVLAGLLVIKANRSSSHLNKVDSEMLPKRGASRARLTFHQRDNEACKRFAARMSEAEIGCEAALRLLIATELRARWFERALSLESG